MSQNFSKLLEKFRARTVTKIDETSSMQRLGRDEYKYIEGDHELIFQAEMLSGSPKRVIYSSTINKWLPPFQDEEITNNDRERILQKIFKYFADGGFSYKVE